MPALLHNNILKLNKKKNRIDKKKRFLGYRQERKGQILAIKVNTTKVLNKIIKIKCFNYNKKD